MLPEEKIQELRELFMSISNPLILFDDDPDGLCSYIITRKFIGAGKGVCIKASATVDVEWLRKVAEYNPDYVIILDKPNVTQEFIDECGKPVIWVDHHAPQNRQRVQYFNPRNYGEGNFPTSYLVYQAAQDYLWISMVGCTADWVIHPEVELVKKQYADLVADAYENPEDLLFDSDFGTIAKIFSFNLKGDTKSVNKNISRILEIEDPYELLQEKTDVAKSIVNYYRPINEKYTDLLGKIDTFVSDDGMLIYTYKDDLMSLSQDASNETLYNHPDKFVIVGRIKSGEVRMSLRSKKHVIPPILEKALESVEGHGGGHEHACGASVKVEDFDRFVALIREQL